MMRQQRRDSLVATRAHGLKILPGALGALGVKLAPGER
jgi:hypothetical protein